MCGIFAIINKEQCIDMRQAKKAAQLMSHRGPDYFGFKAISKNIIFAHNRLSIIDLNERSNQPFIKNDLCIIFNGEIYNYKELILEHKLRISTESDTEVLLLMYEKYGKDSLKYLNGMFSFIIYNLSDKTLFVARDRLGIKPLYYAETNDGIIFASEIAPILEVINDKSLDEFGIRQYRKFRMIIKGDTVYKNIKMFPAAHYFRNQYFYKYWDVDFSPQKAPSYEKLKALLSDACLIRTRADVPVGSYLSGGIDSTILSYISKPEYTWTVGFKEMNEFKWAEIANSNLQSKLHKTLVNKEEFINTTIQMVKKRKEPLSVPNEVLIYLMTQDVKKRNTVVLSGEGADELFWGYDMIFKWANSTEKLQINDFDKYYCYGSHHDDEIIDYALNDLPGEKVLDKIAYFFQIYHLHGLLRRLDNSTMFCSVEARVPFVDHRLVEMMAGVSFEWKMGDSVKYPLKKIFKNIIPAKIIKREKVGFPVPLKLIFSLNTKNTTPFDDWLAFNLKILNETGI